MRRLKSILDEVLERFFADDVQTRTLLINAARDLVLKGVGLAGFLVMNVVLARGLGVEAFGHYAFVLSTMILLSLAVRQGMDSGLLRFVSVYSAQEKWGLLKGVILWMTLRVGVVAIVVSLIGFVGLLFLGPSIAPGLRDTGFWGLIFLPLVTLSQMNQFALRGRLQIVRAQVPDLVIQPYGVTVVVSLLLWGGVSVTGSDAMAITVFSAAVGTLLGWVWLKSSLPRAVFSARAERDGKTWRQVSTHLLLVAGAGFVLTQMDIVMLGVLTTTDLSGPYSIASRLSALSIFATFALGSIGAPMIASLYAERDVEGLTRLVKLIARISLATVLPMAVLFAVAGPAILLLFGDQFQQVYVPLLILVGGQMLAACFGPAVMLLTMTAGEDMAARILLASVVVNFVLNGLLIPHFGMVGASIATAVATTITASAMFFSVRRQLGINSSAF